MRLFFAIPLPPALQARIASWRDTLSLPRAAARVPAPNMHITLAFLGDVPPLDVPVLMEIGARVANREERRGEVVLDRVGCWRSGVLFLAPSLSRARPYGKEGEGEGRAETGKGRERSYTESSQGVVEKLHVGPVDGTETSGLTSCSQATAPVSTTSSLLPRTTMAAGLFISAATNATVSPVPSRIKPPPPQAIYALAASLAAELSAAGIKFDKRKFSAHLTLARRADRVRARARFRVPVTRLVLYESRSEGLEGGVVYGVLGEWALAGESRVSDKLEGG